MKVIKILMMCSLIVLTSCSFNITKDDVDKVKDVFSKQLDNLYQLYESGAKDILSDLSVEKAEEMLNGLLSKIPDDKKELIYGGIEKGVSLLEDGKEILANELSIDVSLEGMKNEIEDFLQSLADLDARISVGDVSIEKTDGNYKLDCTINFFYNANDKAQEGSFTASFNKTAK